MTDYIKQYDTPRHAFEKQEAERLIAKFETDATVTDGVVRWDSNNRVPPSDILELWRHVGKVFDFDKSYATQQADQDADIADYRRRMANHVHSAEELSEMRAVFGPGATVVNVLTGQKTQL